MGKANTGKVKRQLTFKNYQQNLHAGSKQNRWSMTLGLLSGNFTKLILLNLLILLFMLPTIALILQRNMALSNLATNYPFMQNTGVGYPFYPSMIGLAEVLQLSANRYFYLAFACFAIIGSLAVAGGMYFMRNFVWSNGQFVTKDFFKGIKKNYLLILIVSVIYALILCLCLYSMAISDYFYALNNKWYYIASKVSAIIIIALFTIIYMYCCAFIVTYKVNLWQAIKNSFRFTFSFFIPNVLMALFALIPFILTFFTNSTSSMMGTIVIMLISFFGFVFVLLVWSSYTQFVFDKTVNGVVDNTEKRLPENKKSKNAKETEVQEPTSKKYVKPVTDNVVIEQLPEMFSRKDLQKLEESKRAMREDSDKYYKEHKEKGE